MDDNGRLADRVKLDVRQSVVRFLFDTHVLLGLAD